MIEKIILLLVVTSVNYQVFSQETIPDWFLNEMQNDIGTWYADNSEYKNEQEVFDKYQIVWEWSIKNYSLKGQLFGVHKGNKSSVFWAFRKVWDSKQEKPKIIQIGLDGTYGVGHIQKINENETQLSQIFQTPNGLEYKEGHKTIRKSDTLHLGSSYSISKDEKWEKKRSYIWIKETETVQVIKLIHGLSFFNTIEGIWEGMPQDSSFVSVLDYKIGNKEHFVFVDNDLLTKERKLFSHYEGAYFHNPNTSRIEFSTINKSEIHSGYCKISKDTLFHFATIKRKTGSIRAYSSAIVKLDNKTLAYYAVYGKDEKIPELKFENPLIYRKRE